MNPDILLVACMGMPEVTVFVMNYNGMRFAKACLDAIGRQTIKHNIVFMDNHSSDGSWEYAKRRGVRVFRNRKNLYINRLQQQALDMCKTKYAAFCHIDCLPEKRWLEKLYRAAEKENAGAAEPEIVHPNGQVLYGGLTRWFAPRIGKCERHPIAVCTAATLYRNTGLRLFDPTFIHYHDDDHSSEVLKRAGWPLIHEKGCMVEHYGSHSGMMGLKWKLLARFNQARMIVRFRHPAPNPGGQR